METVYAKEKEARDREQERISEKKRAAAIISEIKKYQAAIKDVQDKIDNPPIELTCDVRDLYKRMIGDYTRLEGQLRKDLKEICARGLPLPPARNCQRYC
jgi:hypothetical protein